MVFIWHLKSRLREYFSILVSDLKEVPIVRSALAFSDCVRRRPLVVVESVVEHLRIKEVRKLHVFLHQSYDVLLKEEGGHEVVLMLDDVSDDGGASAELVRY